MIIPADIETIPGQAHWVREYIAETVSHPKNMKREETIEKWEAEEKGKEIDSKWSKTGLDGTLGEVWCIGVAFDDGPVTVLSRSFEECTYIDQLEDDTDIYSPEADLLQAFFSLLESRIDKRADGSLKSVTWVGHNLLSFDLRFLYQRCVANNVKPTVKLPYNAKPWDMDVYDTCTEWRGSSRPGSGASSKLEEICKALGISCKDGMSGADVWPAIQAGEYQKVIDYCKSDVEATREVYKRMNFLE